jgi:hypothetical protein
MNVDWPHGYDPEPYDELEPDEVLRVLVSNIEKLEGRHGLPPLKRIDDGQCDDCETYGRRYRHGTFDVCRPCATRRRRILYQRGQLA